MRHATSMRNWKFGPGELFRAEVLFGAKVFLGPKCASSQSMLGAKVVLVPNWVWVFFVISTAFSSWNVPINHNDLQRTLLKYLVDIPATDKMIKCRHLVQSINQYQEYPYRKICHPQLHNFGSNRIKIWNFLAMVF